MKIKFQHKKFKNTSLLVIARANAIIEEYEAKGYKLTLRQLYYQFIARDEFPDAWLVSLGGGKFTKNHEKNYKKLIPLMNNARLAGLVSWEAIEDLTRSCVEWRHDIDPATSLREVERRYVLDPWEGQGIQPEIWVEKEALSSVFRRVGSREHVPFFACRGYHSASSAWDARNRILDRFQDTGQRTLVLHFGDHDPSGLDMTRDIIDRFAVMGVDEEILEVRRMALNMDQIEKLNPPPSPAKPGDSRTPEYEARFGTSDTWELDAVDVTDLEELAVEEIQTVIDEEAREIVETREANDKAALAHARASLDTFNPEA